VTSDVHGYVNLDMNFEQWFVSYGNWPVM